MKKYIISILLVVILLVGLVGFMYFRNNIGQKSDTSSNYNATQTSTENKQEENTATNINTEVPSPAITEEDIITFSTNVSGTSARKKNISICTSLLNDTTIESGQTFSFWETVGNTSPEKGYQKAKSFDENGKTVKTYGGRSLSSQYDLIQCCIS